MCLLTGIEAAQKHEECQKKLVRLCGSFIVILFDNVLSIFLKPSEKNFWDLCWTRDPREEVLSFSKHWNHEIHD